ncbi:uncharacterized protein LOC134934192 [Pseudophryne corroboree]|uniref:uncharacterized protein LOC134934192 n=1 Tax=Pseudophryne corroboree TaxID=495146 RepID=UPI003081E6CD
MHTHVRTYRDNDEPGYICQTHEAEKEFCVDQPKALEAFVGDSVTFPCSFVYPASEDRISSVDVAVKADSGRFCGNNENEIYNTATMSSSRGYEGRVSVMLDRENRNASVTIRNLQSGESKYYCCRMQIKLQDGNIEIWQHAVGTYIRVRGADEGILEQPPFIPALAGDTVTLLSRLKTKNNPSLNVTACRVRWDREDTGCGSNSYDINCTTSPNILFSINHVNSSHQGWYCLSIDFSTGDGPRSAQRETGTQLLILQPENTLNISQPPEVVFNNPLIINCSFSVPNKRVILHSAVYWMMGNPREHFVFHPDPDYIHPDYKGKTQLVGDSDLHLNVSNVPDNTTLYCRVVIKRCASGQGNQIDTILEEGPGTRLRVHGKK